MILCDPSAERAVLAGVFTYGDRAYLEISDIVSDASFTIDSNAIIYKCLKQLCDNNSKVDVASVYSVADDLGFGHIFAKKEEAQHLRAIIDFPVTFENIRKFAAKIRKLEIARLLHKQLEVAQDKLLDVSGSESINQILSLAEDTVFDFTNLLNDGEHNPCLIS